MSAVPNQKQTLRTAGAIVAGFLVIVVLSIGTDFLTHAIGVFPEPGEAMSAALYILASASRVQSPRGIADPSSVRIGTRLR